MKLLFAVCMCMVLMPSTNVEAQGQKRSEMAFPPVRPGTDEERPQLPIRPPAMSPPMAPPEAPWPPYTPQGGQLGVSNVEVDKLRYMVKALTKVIDLQNQKIKLLEEKIAGLEPKK